MRCTSLVVVSAWLVGGALVGCGDDEHVEPTMNVELSCNDCPLGVINDGTVNVVPPRSGGVVERVTIEVTSTGGVELPDLPVGADAVRLTLPASAVAREVPITYRCTAPGDLIVTLRDAGGGEIETETDAITCADDAEIDIEGPNGPIADAGSDEVGSVPLGIPFTRSFDVIAGAGAPLVVSGASVGSEMNCTATIAQQPSSPMPPTLRSSFSVTVTPTAEGMFTCRVAVASNDADENPYEIDITGTATVGPVPEIGIAGASGAIADGGSDDVGTVTTGGAAVRSFTISNTGAADLTVGGVTVTTQTNCTATVTMAPGATVAPAGTTTFEVTATPTADGVFTCAIEVASNDADENPYDIAITGTATAAPTPEISIDGMAGAIADGGTDDAGTRTIGVAFTRAFTIDNTGGADLTTTGVTGGTPTNCTIAVTMQPTSPIAAAGSTTFEVSVVALAAGPFSCPFTVESNDADEDPYDIAVTGTGEPPAAPEIDVSGPGGAIASGGSDAAGDQAAGVAFARSFTIENSGTATLAVSAVNVGTETNCALAVDTQPAATVAAAGMTMFMVSVTPTAAGAFSCGLSIDSDDADENPYDLTVDGTGI